jgi:hypothetical protein
MLENEENTALQSSQILLAISARNTKVYKICKLYKAIFSAFYNISQPNLQIY